MQDRHCHTSSILVSASAHEVFLFMADGSLAQGQWVLESWNQKKADRLYAGTTLSDGQLTWVRIHSDAAHGLIDYEVGRPADSLAFRNTTRIFDGKLFGHPDGTALIKLTTCNLVAQRDAYEEQYSSGHDRNVLDPCTAREAGGRQSRKRGRHRVEHMKPALISN